jgi:type IV secretory pathway VirB3-like protein
VGALDRLGQQLASYRAWRTVVTQVPFSVSSESSMRRTARSGLMEPRGRSGIGCLGSLLGMVIVVAVVVAVVFAGLIALGIVAAVVIVGLVVFAIDRLLLAISPKRRERRANLQRSFMVWGTGTSTGPGPVIDSTARLVDPDSGTRSGEETE